jgi:hypothetical protein
MRPVLPTTTIQWQTEIPMHIVGGKGGRWIARETQPGRDLIREIRHGLSSVNDPFTLDYPLGALELSRIAEKSGNFPNAGKPIIERTHTQDGGSVQRAGSRIERLAMMMDVLEELPTRPPGVNPVENSLAVHDENRLMKGKLFDVRMAAWNMLTLSVVNSWAADMPPRIQKLCDSEGNRLDD